MQVKWLSFSYTMSKKTSDPAVDIEPDMGDTEALFPPSPSAVPVESASGTVPAHHESVPAPWAVPFTERLCPLSGLLCPHPELYLLQFLSGLTKLY